MLTVGSFVPWLYYCFYCKLIPKICYLVLIFTLGGGCTVVSLMDKFQTPRFRPVRAGKRSINGCLNVDVARLYKNKIYTYGATSNI